ncbi:MAG: hypothetical protein EOP83_19980 [Verrucomicrobiaceae bacterium]|nr:MAG: hypothetical protein EOP83_19980 [Verrucomicrobiaceae bacterium]
MTIIKPMSQSEWSRRTWKNHTNAQYARYRAELLQEFRRRYPVGNRILFNYTMGFTDEKSRWCHEMDPKFTLIENYGTWWPIGFSKPEFAFAFKMRWL